MPPAFEKNITTATPLLPSWVVRDTSIIADHPVTMPNMSSNNMHQIDLGNAAVVKNSMFGLQSNETPLFDRATITIPAPPNSNPMSPSKKVRFVSEESLAVPQQQEVIMATHGISDSSSFPNALLNSAKALHQAELRSPSPPPADEEDTDGSQVSQTPHELEEIKKRVKARADALRQRRERHHKKRVISRAMEAMKAADDDATSSSQATPAPTKVSPLVTAKKVVSITAAPATEAKASATPSSVEEEDPAVLLKQMREQIQAMASEELALLNQCKAIRDKRAKIAKQYKRLAKKQAGSQQEGDGFVLPPTFPN